jgi:hypothetical protein
MQYLGYLRFRFDPLFFEDIQAVSFDLLSVQFAQVVWVKEIHEISPLVSRKAIYKSKF